LTADTSKMVPPLVVVEGLDVTFYRSEDELLVHLEPWYPSSAEYRAFDSQGLPLELVADPPVVRRRVFGPIWTDNAHESTLSVQPLETEPSAAPELAGLLRELLSRAGESPEGLGGQTLEDLLRAAIDRTGFTPRRPIRKRSR
jgi:hypothetical protein